MPDNKNKGIGQYKDRPGYFWGGLVGGAILGALVNKMQGKDWKRGAMWGGITGGLGSAFVGPGSQTAAGTGWLDKMAPGITKSMFSMGAGNPHLFGTIGGGLAAWMAGDPKKTESDYEEWLAEQEAKRRKKQIEAYPYWHTPPWATGGMVNARPGFQYGGGAWSGVESDEEIQGSGQDKIMSITGQGGIEGLGGLEDILETFEMSSGPGQGDLSGWHEMYLDLQGKGQIPGDWDFNDFMENLDMLDISPGDFAQADPQTLGRFPLVGGSNADAQTQGRFPLVGGEMAAEGGYKTRPKYRHAGNVRIEGGIADLDMTGGGRMEEFADLSMKEEEEDETYWKKLLDSVRQGVEEGRIDADKIKDWLDSKGFKAKGGIADLDMTGGGSSFGPGTGTSDDIPAMLSDGEFVVTANAVKNLGGGNRMLGAKKMYQMMNQLDPSSQTPAEMSTVGIA
jgi:hypothetical protein